MPRISHLQLQRRRADRVNVFIGDEYAFSLLLDLAVRLKVDQDITDIEIAALQAEDGYRVALDRALRWLALRPRSRLDVERYLADKDVPPDVAPRVVQRLVELEYVDDHTFARWWVDNRAAHRPRGRQVLRHELSLHGVAPEIIADVTGDLDEPSAAIEMALAQAHRYHADDHTTFNRRLGSYLSRRGFEYGAIREALAVAWRAMSDDARPDGRNTDADADYDTDEQEDEQEDERDIEGDDGVDA